MAGIDFDELTKKIASYDKEDIRESLENLLCHIESGRVDAYAIILCEKEKNNLLIESRGNGNILGKSLVTYLELYPELNTIFTSERAERVMKRLNDKYNKK